MANISSDHIACTNANSMYQEDSLNKLKNSESTLADMRSIDEPEAAFDFAAIAVGDCCMRP